MQEPMYIQIHNKIKKDIENKKWLVGERIPAERQLAIDFNVSRMTLRQAIKTLEDEGILERRLGSGTYVANQKVQEKVSGIMGFTEMMTAQGKTPASQTISFRMVQPSLSEKEKLELADEEEVLRMERVRFADGVPICYEIASVPRSLVNNYTRDEITTSLYQVLENKGHVNFGHVEQRIGASIANEETARLLDIKKGEAVVTRRQVSHLDTNQPFEYVRAQYVAERFEFIFES